MLDFFRAVFYQPLYNGLIFLMDLLPWFDVGIIVVLFTILVKLVLFPLSRKAVSAQLEMKSLEPELTKIKKDHKDDRQEQARRTMALYKERKINPFSSVLVVLIQLPIIFALYFVFLKSGLPIINADLLYSFVPTPESINMNFLGLLNITEKSIILALLAGISSFFQIRFSLPAKKNQNQNKNDKPSFKDDFAKSMNLQMRYIFPIVVVFIAYSISGVIALYWLTSNLFTIAQEVVIRKKFAKN